MWDLDLRDLAAGIGNLTAEFGAALAQAGAVSFETQDHASGAELALDGDYVTSLTCLWKPCDDKARRCWNDREMATEFGAEGIAILLVHRYCRFQVVERSWKGTGFDYWLGDEDSMPFQSKARLEVSGIGSGTRADVQRRVRIKTRQTDPSDSTGLPAYVVVVEFGSPTCTFVKK